MTQREREMAKVRERRAIRLRERARLIPRMARARKRGRKWNY